MKINSLDIKNFRLLRKVKNFQLDFLHTIIVWRNNSWKTSLTELFKKFFDDWSSFQFDDFSIETHDSFNKSFELYKDYFIEDDWNTDEKESKFELFKNSIPKIELLIKFILEDWDEWLEFVQDLDDETNEYTVLLEYTFKDVLKFLWNINLDELEENFNFINYIKKNYYWNFEIKKFLVSSSGIQQIQNFNFKRILNIDFIDAQRHLDDNSTDNNKTLSKIFETYYKLNSEWKNEELDKTLDGINTDLDSEYEKFFNDLHSDLKTFWYPWLWNEDKKLKLKSELKSTKLLEWNNSKIYYSQQYYDLPESYNGLWYSNLIYIILQFIHLYWEFNKLRPRPQFELLFIEEPEAHLHPQMQQTFIKQIQNFIDKRRWNIQIIITTHSSHIVSSSEFDKIRYFVRKEEEWTEIKNLWSFSDTESNKSFLHKYLTLEKADIFFADKLIMIEWMVERILLPLFIEKIDNEIIDIKEKLSSQYISTIEVWWVYAHKFKEFLEFLWIKTLIITDIDSVDKKIKGEKELLGLKWDDDLKYKKYKVADSTRTSNYTIINWIPSKSKIEDLKSLSEDKKVQWKFRVAYQVEENWNIWRSFEDAFILANLELLANFKDKKDSEWKIINKSEILEKKFKDLNKNEIEKDWYWNIAQYIDKNDKKTDFAFDIMMLEDFNVPKYIKEGLLWLSKK